MALSNRWSGGPARWSVVAIGLVLSLAAAGQVAAGDDAVLVDAAESALPLGVAVGLTAGGVWLSRNAPAEQTVRVARWTVGGIVVGLAASLWLAFVTRLDGTPVAELTALQVNGTAVMTGAASILGYYYADLQRREQTLERLESRFRALTENSPFVVVTIDETATIRYANDAVEDRFGYAPDEVVGEPLTTLVPDWDREEGRRDSHDWVELTAVDAEGEEFPVEVSFGEYSVDETHLFTGVIHDVSDRKDAKARLRAQTEKLADMHERATDITAAETTGEVYDRTVEAATTIFPCDAACIVDGGDVAACAGEGFRPEESDAEARKYADPVNRTDGVLRIGDLDETRSATADGSGVEPDAGPPLSADDGPHGLLGVELDEGTALLVVAREPGTFDRTDEEVAELLATHVATGLARVEAEAAIRRERDRLDEFASVVSHDLRNPLNVAQGRLELARAETDVEGLAAVDRALDRMERLLEDVLALARQGDTVGEANALLLDDVVHKAWTSVETGGATLETDLDAWVEADESRLQQAFENLFRNAVEHGGDEVTVRVGELDDGFYVEDDGPGIPPDERDDVFESGYTTSDDGTGFGLAIVKRIVEAHGWEIEVTDRSDGGARFEVSGAGFTDA